MGIKYIATFLNKSHSYVNIICRKLQLGESSILDKEMASKHKFTKQQVEFLTLDATLKRWAGKSMAERTMLFKRRYPYAHITMYKLRKLYRE